MVIDTDFIEQHLFEKGLHVQKNSSQTRVE